MLGKSIEYREQVIGNDVEGDIGFKERRNTLTKNARVYRLVAVGIILIMCLGLALTGVAQASTVTFHFGGTIGGASPTLNSTIFPNTPIQGSYTFQSDTPDLFTLGDPSNNIGQYALSNFSVTFSGRTYSMAPHTRQNYISVENQVFFDSYRVLLIPGSPERALTGPPINGQEPLSFQINIFGNMFTSGALPTTPPSLGIIPSHERTFLMGFLGGVGVPTPTVHGQINSLTIAPVPLPGALLLFGSGLLGLAGLGVHRRLRQA